MKTLKKLSMFLLAAVTFVSVSTEVSAHSLYIQSGRFYVSEGKATPLFFCYGHHLPVDDAVRGKKLSYIRVTAPDKSVQDIKIRDERSLHSYNTPYEETGTYTLTAETNPGYFAIYYDKKGRRRHSLKPLNTFIDNAKEVKSSMRSSQWAKAYVVSGKASAEFPAFAGLPFELVPAKDITALKKGDTIEFQIFNNGKAYTGEGHWDASYTGFSTESEDMYIQKTYSGNGKFTLPIDVEGRWFVRYFTKTDAPEDKKHLYMTEKRTATIVFEVKNERKRPKIDSH